MKSKRILFIAASVLAFALALSLFSVFFGIGHACSCDTEDCQICEFWSEPRKNDTVLGGSAPISFVICSFFLALSLAVFVFVIKSSPIKLKVKLSD